MNDGNGRLWPHLQRAPMGESVLHVKVAESLTDGPADDERVALERGLSPLGYVFDRDILSQNVRVDLAPGKDVGGDFQVRHLGWKYKNRDGHRVIQRFRDGMAFSWLRPYPSWAEFSSAAFDAWDRIPNATEQDMLLRVGLRAINQIVLTGGLEALPRYLKGVDVLPESGYLREGFMKCDTLRLREGGLRANVVRSVAPPTPFSNGNPILVYDVDAFSCPGTALSRDALRACVEALHVFRNSIFFSEMTEEALGEFR